MGVHYIVSSQIGENIAVGAGRRGDFAAAQED